MFSTVSFDLIGQIMAAPFVYTLLAFPVVVVVIVVSTIWTKR